MVDKFPNTSIFLTRHAFQPLRSLCTSPGCSLAFRHLFLMRQHIQSCLYLTMCWLDSIWPIACPCSTYCSSGLLTGRLFCLPTTRYGTKSCECKQNRLRTGATMKCILGYHQMDTKCLSIVDMERAGLTC